jgi:hypothetical protein
MSGADIIMDGVTIAQDAALLSLLGECLKGVRVLSIDYQQILMLLLINGHSSLFSACTWRRYA